jgi:hypothetical protein
MSGASEDFGFCKAPVLPGRKHKMSKPDRMPDYDIILN